MEGVQAVPGDPLPAQRGCNWPAFEDKTGTAFGHSWAAAAAVGIAAFAAVGIGIAFAVGGNTIAAVDRAAGCKPAVAALSYFAAALACWDSSRSLDWQQRKGVAEGVA